MRKPYQKPIIQTAKMKPVGRKALSPLPHNLARATYRARFRTGKTIFVRKAMDTAQLKIILELRRLGLNVERPLLDKPFGTDQKMLFENLGTDLQALRKKAEGIKAHGGARAQLQRIKRILQRQLPSLVGRMHAHSIGHNHLHERNFTIKQGKLGLIDFSEVSRKNIEWESPESIYRGLGIFDYRRLLYDTLIKHGFTPPEARSVFRRMVEYYPTTSAVKAQVMQKVDRLLDATHFPEID